MPAPKDSLNARQLAFCREFCVDLNASAAARRAGYAERTAGRHAADLMQDSRIQAEIQRLTAAKVARASMEADEVVEQLANIIRADISDVLTWGMSEVEDSEGLPVTLPNGEAILRPHISIIDSSRLSRAVTGAIAEVSMTDKGTFKVKMHDKGAAIEKLMRHLGMFEQDNKQVADGLAQLIEAAQGTTLPLAPRSMATTAPEGADE